MYFMKYFQANKCIVCENYQFYRIRYTLKSKNYYFITILEINFYIF